MSRHCHKELTLGQFPKIHESTRCGQVDSGILRLDLCDAANIPLNSQVKRVAAVIGVMDCLLLYITVGPHASVVDHAGSDRCIRCPSVWMIGKIVFGKNYCRLGFCI